MRSHEDLPEAVHDAWTAAGFHYMFRGRPIDVSPGDEPDAMSYGLFQARPIGVKDVPWDSAVVPGLEDWANDSGLHNTLKTALGDRADRLVEGLLHDMALWAASRQAGLGLFAAELRASQENEPRLTLAQWDDGEPTNFPEIIGPNIVDDVEAYPDNPYKALGRVAQTAVEELGGSVRAVGAGRCTDIIRISGTSTVHVQRSRVRPTEGVVTLVRVPWELPIDG
jgi:hypothetical protein